MHIAENGTKKTEPKLKGEFNSLKGNLISSFTSLLRTVLPSWNDKNCHFPTSPPPPLSNSSVLRTPESLKKGSITAGGRKKEKKRS